MYKRTAVPSDRIDRPLSWRAEFARLGLGDGMFFVPSQPHLRRRDHPLATTAMNPDLQHPSNLLLRRPDPIVRRARDRDLDSRQWTARGAGSLAKPEAADQYWLY
jgi:hypothetical protein